MIFMPFFWPLVTRHCSFGSFGSFGTLGRISLRRFAAPFILAAEVVQDGGGAKRVVQEWVNCWAEEGFGGKSFT
jgi:hypothetical protein